MAPEDFIEVYGPSFIAGLGTALYLLEYSDNNDVKTRLKSRIRNFEKYMESLDTNTPHRHYLERLYEHAQQLAHGKIRRKKMFEKKREAIQESFDINMRLLEEENQIREKVSEWGERVLAGGIGFGVAEMGFEFFFKSLDYVGIKIDPATEQYFKHSASATVGGLFAYLSKGIRHRMYARSIARNMRKYERDLKEIENEYREDLRKEWWRAWKMACIAWEGAFQRDIPERDKIMEDMIMPPELYNDEMIVKNIKEAIPEESLADANEISEKSEEENPPEYS